MDAASDEEAIHFLWKKLWWKIIPSKIPVFSWKVIRERPPTKDNLMVHGLSEGLGDGSCSMCFGSIESSNHILFSCSVAFVWQAISLWLNKLLSYASTARDHFSEFVESENGKCKRKIMDVI